MSAKLVNENTGREHEIKPEGTTIGRHSENEISLPGRSVSRFHAEISLGEKGWILEDHGSTYGTFVNGQRVEGVVDLADGDKVRIAVSKSAPDGEFNFVFRSGREGVGQKLKRAARAIVNRKKVELGSLIFERSQGIVLVRMSGIFRRREMDTLSKDVAQALRAGDRVVLDLTGVKYMNSYGLACLVQLGTAQREKGSSLRVFGAAGTVLKLLSLVGSESPVELFGDEAGAAGGA